MQHGIVPGEIVGQRVTTGGIASDTHQIRTRIARDPHAKGMGPQDPTCSSHKAISVGICLS